ncbi:MAG: NAD(P)/FAD-dependent oxidoreductase [Thermomicrobiales bacterium]
MAGSAIIIGGGVIGLCTAFALQRRGARVTVIDAGPRERAASHVNAGWICPSLSEPVPAPGLAQQSARWMLKSDSPLYIAPRTDPAFLRWLAAFWRSCNAAQYTAGTAATAALAEQTMTQYDALRAAGVEFEEHRDGLLFAYLHEDALQHDYQNLDTLAPYGVEIPPILSGDEARDLEPSLSRLVAGGYWLRQERSVRPDTLVAGLWRRLEINGATMRPGETVVGMGATNGKVRSVITDLASYDADVVVVAAGAWTPQVVAPLGVKVPIEGGKGYSIDFTPPPPLPAPIQHPLYLHETRVAITPMDGMVRVAGTMELSGLNHIVRPERVRALVSRTGEVIAGWPENIATSGPGVKVWHGHRPLTPDGLAVIGWAKGWRNLAIASGHAMMGVTLAPATAEALADLIDTGRRPDILRPFDPARFA